MRCFVVTYGIGLDVCCTFVLLDVSSVLMVLEVCAEQISVLVDVCSLLAVEVFGGCKSDLQSDLDVNGLMNFGYVELRLIIEWSRKVPGWFMQ